MDAVVRRVAPGAQMDRDGERAARGATHGGLLDELLRDEYFDRPPPRSTGRERFGEAIAERIVGAVSRPDDAVSTALDFTVRSIAGELTRWLPAEAAGELVVSGGGARNPVLIARLRAAMPEWNVRLFSDVFFDGDAKEAVAFAFLGHLRLAGRPGNVPAATGARAARVLGAVTPPSPPRAND
jgi:anhydro-N-acetylmuramic acid kinase